MVDKKDRNTISKITEAVYIQARDDTVHWAKFRGTRTLCGKLLSRDDILRAITSERKCVECVKIRWKVRMRGL